MFSIKCLSTLFCCLLSLLVAAQGSKKPGHLTMKDIVSLVSQYPYCFESMIGSTVSEKKSHWEYACVMESPKMEDCKVIKSKSDSTNCSMEAIVLTTADYDKAVEAYKTLFNSFRNTKIYPMGIKMSFVGKFVNPSKQQKTSRSIIKMIPGDEETEDMRVQISLISFQDRWQVLIRIASEINLSTSGIR